MFTETIKGPGEVATGRQERTEQTKAHAGAAVRSHGAEVNV